MQKATTTVIILAFACSSLLSGAARAEENCSVFDDRNDHYSFGLQLGSDVRKITPSGNPFKCVENTETFDADCFFTDNDGIVYGVIDQKIVRKELVDRNLAHYDHPLVAGITRSDSLEEAQRKLGLLPKDFPKWVLSDSSAGGGDWLYFLNTGPCLRGSNGTVWEYELIFDRSKQLVFVRASVEGYTPDY